MPTYMCPETGWEYHKCDEDCEVFCECCDKSFCTADRFISEEIQFFDNSWDRHYVCVPCIATIDPEEKQYLRPVQ